MNDIPQWFNTIIAAVGGLFGAWLGVKIAITRLQVEVANLKTELTEIKSEHKEAMTALNASHKETRSDFHKLRNEITPLNVILQMVCEKTGIPWPGAK